MRRMMAVLAVAFAVALGSATGAAAQSPAPEATTRPDESTAGPETPRGAVAAYLEAARDHDYTVAARYLVNGDATLARQLKIVLDRELWINLAQLSTLPTGETDDRLAANRDRVGTITTGGGKKIAILLARDGDGDRHWRFAPETVRHVPNLYQEFGDGPMAEILPAVLVETSFLDVRLWQWLGVIAIAIAALIVAWVVARLLGVVASRLAARSATTLDDTLLGLVMGPLELTIALMLFASGTSALGLAVPVHRFFLGFQKGVAIFAVTWLLSRIVDAVAQTTLQRMTTAGRISATSIVPLARRTAKIFLGSIAIIAMLQNFGVNVTGIIAGLGVGGLAVALAAQKTVENLFGGVTLISDQPVRVGDFCRFGDRVGTVEDIGLRSTRVRTLDRTVVSIPNAEFASIQLENFARRDRIWLHPTLGLRYETTPDQLRHVLIELKKLLLAHPKVDPNPARVRFTGFGAYSLDIDVFAYVRTTDIQEFLAVQEDIFLRIIDIVAASGTGFAFPSQTIYTAQDTGLDEARTRAATEQVAKWRAEHALGLPDPTAEDVTSLSDTLDYPPQGAPRRA